MREVVLVVAHGTVSSLDELPEFLRSIRHGRPVPDELLAETRRRYALIGGSPLQAITEAQTQRLAERLGRPARVAMRLWNPRLEVVLAELAAEGVERAVVLPLAPYSVDVYQAAAVAARAAVPAAAGLELVAVAAYGSAPELVAAHAAQIRKAAGFEGADAVILSAHSLPVAAIRAGDRYAAEVTDSVAAIGAALGRPVTLAYQSQSQAGDWLGPDLRTSLEEAARGGARRVLLAPIGFLAEHVETLYDLDVEASAWAVELGLELERVPTLGTAPAFIEALAAVVERAGGARP